MTRPALSWAITCGLWSGLLRPQCVKSAVVISACLVNEPLLVNSAVAAGVRSFDSP